MHAVRFMDDRIQRLAVKYAVLIGTSKCQGNCQNVKAVPALHNGN